MGGSSAIAAAGGLQGAYPRNTELGGRPIRGGCTARVARRACQEQWTAMLGCCDDPMMRDCTHRSRDHLISPDSRSTGFSVAGRLVDLGRDPQASQWLAAGEVLRRWRVSLAHHWDAASSSWRTKVLLSISVWIE